MCKCILVGIMALVARIGMAQEPALLNAMETEMKRAADAFKTNTPPLYYLACGVTDTELASVSASFGAITRDDYNRSRILDVDARCGDYKRDNTHPLPGHMWDGWAGRSDVPVDDDQLAVRMALWSVVEGACRNAAERYAQVKALDLTKAEIRDKADDFSQGQVEKLVEPRKTFKVSRETWKEKVKRCSLPFTKFPNVYNGSVSISATARTRTFVSSEGSRLQFSQLFYRMSVYLMTRSDDGLDLPLYQSYFAWKEEDLPSDEKVLARVAELGELAEKLRKAPLVDPYTGPAILEGEAAAVFMHEVMGHRFEGHRQKDEKMSQTFRGLMGQKILPEEISIIFDPTILVYRGKPVSGFYNFDEEGTKAERCVTVDKGVLKSFLMSRVPIENFPKSNGHGRAGPGNKAVSRQSNLIIESSKPVPAADLRKMLIEECRKQNKPYGLLFQQVEGGFTMTGRYVPNAFNVSPLVVWRIFADGKPDELVRGVDIIGTPLTALTKIVAAGDDLAVFNGICGAESGGVPVGAASPSLLLGQIEVQEKEISRAKPPILPVPDGEERK